MGNFYFNTGLFAHKKLLGMIYQFFNGFDKSFCLRIKFIHNFFVVIDEIIIISTLSFFKQGVVFITYCVPVGSN